MRALIVVCLSLCLISCSTTYHPSEASAALTADCAYPVITGDTYREALRAYEQRGLALRECTARLRALR